MPTHQSAKTKRDASPTDADWRAVDIVMEHGIQFAALQLRRVKREGLDGGGIVAYCQALALVGIGHQLTVAAQSLRLAAVTGLLEPSQAGSTLRKVADAVALLPDGDEDFEEMAEAFEEGADATDDLD